MANDAIAPGSLLDQVLDEIEELTRVESERHMAVVIMSPSDDAQAIQVKRAQAVERLGVHPASVDLTVYVNVLAAP